MPGPSQLSQSVMHEFLVEAGNEAGRATISQQREMHLHRARMRAKQFRDEKAQLREESQRELSSVMTEKREAIAKGREIRKIVATDNREEH